MVQVYLKLIAKPKSMIYSLLHYSIARNYICFSFRHGFYDSLSTYRSGFVLSVSDLDINFGAWLIATISSVRCLVYSIEFTERTKRMNSITLVLFRICIALATASLVERKDGRTRHVSNISSK